jgi:hypothetical protein
MGAAVPAVQIVSLIKSFSIDKKSCKFCIWQQSKMLDRCSGNYYLPARAIFIDSNINI